LHSTNFDKLILHLTNANFDQLCHNTNKKLGCTDTVRECERETDSGCTTIACVLFHDENNST